MTPSHEDQGTGFDPAARDYELQGRKAAPDPEPAPDADLPATDARDDFAADPAETLTVRPAFDPVHIAPQAPPAAQPAQDGPKDPEPAPAAPAAPTAPATVVLPEATVPRVIPVASYLENAHDHPSRLPPAARPIRQG